jgi:hypothetical protein
MSRRPRLAVRDRPTPTLTLTLATPAGLAAICQFLIVMGIYP